MCNTDVLGLSDRRDWDSCAAVNVAFGKMVRGSKASPPVCLYLYALKTAVLACRHYLASKYYLLFTALWPCGQK